MVARTEVLRDEVGVVELVAGLAACRLEADAEGRQVGLPLTCEQCHDQAGVDPARQQHAHGHVGDHAPRHRDPQPLEHLLLPVAAPSSTGCSGSRLCEGDQ